MLKHIVENIFLSIFLIALLSCSKNSVTPLPTNPREYTWSADTLDFPGSFQTLMWDIWGSDSNNLFVVGHNDGGGGKMFRFDGKSWTDVKLHVFQGGNIPGSIDLLAIYGFSANDIWAVGKRLYDNPNPPPNFLDSSLVIHFNGSQWREERVGRGRNLTAIWGSSPSDIWTSGVDGTLFHFNGSAWQRKPSPVVIPPQIFFNLNSISGAGPDEAYMLGWTDDQSIVQNTYYFFKLQSGEWSVIDSAKVGGGKLEVKWGYEELWNSPWNTLYSVGGGCFKWSGSKWEEMIDTSTYMESIHGSNENNLFMVGHFGQLWHYNGNDWLKLANVEFDDFTYNAVWTDGKEAFVIGSNGRVTLVLHGK